MIAGPDTAGQGNSDPGRDWRPRASPEVPGGCEEAEATEHLDEVLVMARTRRERWTLERRASASSGHLAERSILHADPVRLKPVALAVVPLATKARARPTGERACTPRRMRSTQILDGVFEGCLVIRPEQTQVGHRATRVIDT